MKVVLFLLCLVFYACGTCNWSQKWSASCFDKELKNYYTMSNTFNQSSIFFQNNYYDCIDSGCKQFGTYSPANASLYSITENNTIWTIITTNVSWGFEPSNETESEHITEMMYRAFATKFYFPVNQVTWLDGFSDLGIISVWMNFKQMDQSCTKLEFLGLSWDTADGLIHSETNMDDCMFTQ